MARKKNIPSSGRTILVIDDSPEYLASTKRIIERDGHTVLTAPGAQEGLDVVRNQYVDLVLVDYFMPGMTGEGFVAELRTFNSFVQVILQTGYANEQPPREMLKRLDIQGFHDKSEGPDKLCLWIDVGLKAAYAFQLVQKSRLGLRYILNATPDLHRIQALDDLLQGVLLQTAGLLGAVDAFVAVVSPKQPLAREEGFVALVQDGGDVRIRAATGRFQSPGGVDAFLDEGKIARLRSTLAGEAVPDASGGTIAPLRIGQQTLGVIYLDRSVLDDSDRELLEIFANQAAVAIHNVALYEAAALDPLANVYARRFFEHALLRDLCGAYRTGRPIGLLMVELDDLKGINDRGGQLSRDRAISATGTLLRQATRATDVVGRYGDDQFVVLLPGADAAGIAVVASRVAEAFSRLAIDGPHGPAHVRASIGGAQLAPRSDAPALSIRPEAFFEQTALNLVRAAGAALHLAKASHRESFETQTVAWTTADLSGPGGGTPRHHPFGLQSLAR
jgi:diguanylate cyclase (GGDEF)-like protein